MAKFYFQNANLTFSKIIENYTRILKKLQRIPKC